MQEILIVFIFIYIYTYTARTVSICLTFPGLWAVCVPAAMMWLKGSLEVSIGNRKSEVVGSGKEFQIPKREINQRKVNSRNRK